MRLEPLDNPSLVRRLGLPALALASTVLVAMALAATAGADPLATLGLIATGAAGSTFAVLETLNRATPLIFTGLAVAVAFRAKLWNIGAEAQLYAGAVVTVWLATKLAPPLPLIALAAVAAGAVVLLGPVILKTRAGVDEVVTTLLLNFVMLLFVSWLLEGPMKDPAGMGWPKSEPLPRDLRLPRIADGLRLHWGFALALIAALGVWFVQTSTTLGYEMRAVGANIRAARFAGIPVNAVLVKTALLSGGLAAMAGFSEVAGLKGHLSQDLSPGFGYSGIIVAMLALLHPLGVIATAIFVAGVFVGADSMSRAADVPTYIADMLLATALLTMVLALGLTRFRVVRGMSALFDILLTASFWAAAVRIGTPLIFATLGELICERAGVLNLGIEGIMVAGAFTGWITVWAGLPLWWGVASAMAAGMVFGFLHGVLTVPFGLSQHVVGLGITLLATSTASFAYRLILPEVTSPPKIEPFAVWEVPVLSDLPVLGPAFFAQTPLTYAAFLVAGLVAMVLYRTPLGLSIRAVGENPAAVAAQGGSVTGLRIGAVAVGSGLMAVGGAFLTLSAFSSFFFEMVNGRGWICIALVVFGAWRPGKAVLGALLFAAFDALQIRLQQTPVGQIVPYQAFLAAPYLMSILALVLMSRRAEVPAALMIPWRKGER